MNKSIKDLNKVSVREAADGDLTEFHLEGRFKSGEKFVIAVFDEDCESICDEVNAFIKSKISMYDQINKNNYTGYETKCRKCNHIEFWPFMLPGTSQVQTWYELRKYITDHLQTPMLNNCSNCGDIETVQDVISISEKPDESCF